jgi:hypothetical protein
MAPLAWLLQGSAIRHKIPGIEERFAARFRERSDLRAERKALRDF